MREYGPGNPLVFSHIPKTAGTSLRASLAQALQPTVQVGGFDTSLVAGYDLFEELAPAARAQVHFKPEDIPADAGLVAGHISPWTTMQRFPGADHITLLRSPALRVVSQWIHSRSVSDFDIRHYGTEGQAFRVARLPFREYLAHEMLAANIDNTITRFLAWPHPALRPTGFIEPSEDEDLLRAANDRLDAFGFVGLVEDRASITKLADWLGREIPDLHLNQRTTIPRKRRTDLAAELDPETVALLDHRTRLDRQLWTRVAATALPDADPDEVLRSSWDRAITRYAAAQNERRTGRPVRRAVEFAYGVGYQLRHGRHGLGR